MPVRKIPKNYRNVTGVAASSLKAEGEAQFESTLERDFLNLLEFSPEVKCFEVQPIKLEWLDKNSSPRSYTPDVLVHFIEDVGRAPCLYEVKYRADIKKHWAELHPKFLRAIRHCKEHGWKFHLVTEVEIRTAYLKNVRFLKPFRRQVHDQAQINLLLHTLSLSGVSSPSIMVANFSADTWVQAEWIPVLWHLIAKGEILADLDEPLTMDSRIRPRP